MVRAALRMAGFIWVRSQRRSVETWPQNMANDTRQTGDDDNRSAEEAALSARLRRLGERLGRVRSSQAPDPAAPRAQADTSGMARGLRLSGELVAGVVVGAIIGWLLDRWLGISPWGMIVFLLLGFAAGVVNVMRAAGVSSGPGQGSR